VRHAAAASFQRPEPALTVARFSSMEGVEGESSAPAQIFVLS